VAGLYYPAAGEIQAYLNERQTEIPKEGETYVHCAGGYRSMIAASILKARGWENVIDIEGGFNMISRTGVPLKEYHFQALE
jgi:rhodanese-related sulfurtransferase